MPWVVLDPGVIVSGLLNPEGSPGLLLRVRREGGLDLCVSPPLLEELAEVLTRPKIKSPLDADAVADCCN